MKHNMISKALGAVFLGSAALCAGPAFAGDPPVDAMLTVTGKLSPGACNVSLDGGTSINYGNIAAQSLKAGDYYPLTEQKRTLRVACGALTNAYVSLSDNQAPSVLSDEKMMNTLAVDGAKPEDGQLFGLGAEASGEEGVLKKIGAYTIKMGPATTQDWSGASAQQPQVMSSTDKAAWDASSTAVYMAGGNARYYSTGGADGGTKPATAATFLFPLTVKAALNSRDQLPIDKNIALNGSATFTVSYN